MSEGRVPDERIEELRNAYPRNLPDLLKTAAERDALLELAVGGDGDVLRARTLSMVLCLGPHHPAHLSQEEVLELLARLARKGDVSHGGALVEVVAQGRQRLEEFGGSWTYERLLAPEFREPAIAEIRLRVKYGYPIPRDLYDRGIRATGFADEIADYFHLVE